MEYQEIINLIDNKIADAVADFYNSIVTKFSKNSQQINSETVSEKRQKVLIIWDWYNSLTMK